uniref:Bestrophin homolog n=1 Tax=Loa loa TaxID=7209 RepID=A0A1I7VWH7_LOALO
MTLRRKFELVLIKTASWLFHPSDSETTPSSVFLEAKQVLGEDGGPVGENIDLDLHVDRENWLDPNDPFASSSFCTRNTLDQLAVCQANLKKCLKGSKLEIIPKVIMFMIRR